MKHDFTPAHSVLFEVQTSRTVEETLYLYITYEKYIVYTKLSGQTQSKTPNFGPKSVRGRADGSV